MAACLFKLSSHQYHVETNTHTHIYTSLEEKQIISGQQNCFVWFTLVWFFFLALPPFPPFLSLSLPLCLFHPLSHSNRWGILMKSALPVPICVRNEFHHFLNEGIYNETGWNEGEPSAKVFFTSPRHPHLLNLLDFHCICLCEPVSPFLSV